MSPQFQRWYTPIRLGRGIDHQAFVELLEDGMEAIVTPEAAAIMDIVRTLRVTSKSTGDTEIRSGWNDGYILQRRHADPGE